MGPLPFGSLPFPAAIRAKAPRVADSREPSCRMMSRMDATEPRTRRQGTNVRQRNAQVGVRLLPEEMAELQRAAQQERVSPAELLRRRYFATA